MSVEDKDDVVSATKVTKAFVSLTDNFITRGNRGGRMICGLPPRSFMFVIY